MKHSILLIAGIILTVLFLIFSTPLFESLYYEREFSNEMYNQNLYLIVAIVTAVVAWSLAGIYYYVINSVSFSRWYHWLLMLAGTAVLAPVINYTYPDSIFSDLGYDFGAQLFSFCMELIAFATLFGFVSEPTEEQSRSRMSDRTSMRVIFFRSTISLI